MKLKNEALQKLYDKLTTGTFVIDEVFKECDEELSDSITFAQIKDLRDRCDILEKSNKSLLEANLNLCTEKCYLKNRIELLEKQVMQTIETLEKVNTDRNELQRNIDILSASEREALSANNKLKEDLDNAKGNVKYFKHSRDDWRSRAKHAEEEVRKQTDKKIQELKSRLNAVYGVRDFGDYEQGRTDLWDMLQNVNDAKPFELATCFPDVTCMDDILGWDLEDFLDAYKKWERIKYMRDYVERFCIGRLCTSCPLHADGFTCGRNKWIFGVPDKDVKKYYEKAKGCGQCPFKRKDD